MCGEISQTTTAEIVEVANSTASQSKLQELLPVYFYSWQLQNLEAVIIHLLLSYFVLWRDGSEMRRDRQAFKEHIARLKNRVAELEKNRDPNLKEHSERHDSRNEVNRVTAELEESEPEINRRMKQVQELQLQNEKLQIAHNEVCVRLSVRVADNILVKYLE